MFGKCLPWQRRWFRPRSPRGLIYGRLRFIETPMMLRTSCIAPSCPVEAASSSWPLPLSIVHASYRVPPDSFWLCRCLDVLYVQIDLQVHVHLSFLSIVKRLLSKHRKPTISSWNISLCRGYRVCTLFCSRSFRSAASLAKMMNWSEGVLFRHSRPSKGREVLLRQKEYFAKVRAGKLSAKAKRAPPSIRFLARPAFSTPDRHRTSAFQTPAFASSKKRTRDHDDSKIHHSISNDDDLELPTVAEFPEVQAEEEALRQKRRKLLLKGDWTGIGLQKPIEMEFSTQRAPGGGPWSHSKSRHAKSKSKMCRALGIRYHSRQPRDPKIFVNNTGPASIVQIRVRVGSREKLFGGSSNNSPQSRLCRDVESSPTGMCDASLFQHLLA